MIGRGKAAISMTACNYSRFGRTRGSTIWRVQTVPMAKLKTLFFTFWYISRRAIANERLKRNRAGHVVLQSKSLYKDAARRGPPHVE